MHVFWRTSLDMTKPVAVSINQINTADLTSFAQALSNTCKVGMEAQYHILTM